MAPGGEKLRKWKARREFERLVREKDIEEETCTAEPWLAILRENNWLAQEKIRSSIAPYTRQLVHPFVFLLLAGVDDLESLQEVHKLYPEVLSQVLTDESDVTALPLHAACASKVGEKVLLFLVEAYPEACLMKNSAGALPLHELLKNPDRPSSIREVAELLDTFNKGMESEWNLKEDLASSTTLTCAKKGDKADLGIPLSLAIRNPNTPRNVLALLTQRFPKDCNTLYLGKVGGNQPVSDNLFTLNHLHASLVAKVLPQLTTFHCASKHWNPRAVTDVMKGLCVQKSLVNLTLRLPNPLVEGKGDSTCQMLRQLVQENTTLQYLKLDFGAEYTADTRQSMAQTNVVGAVGGVEVALRYLLEGLRHNDSLQECHFGGVWMKPSDPDFFLRHFWPTLASILRDQNTMLETVTASFFQRNCEGVAKDMQEVQHWTSLNPYGRALFRDPSVPFGSIVTLLGALNDAPDLVEDTTTNKARRSSKRLVDESSTKRLTVLYGLLRESPSLWCDKVKDEPEEAAESAMIVMV